MERRQGRYFIFCAALGMELCWLQAWFGFLMASIFHCRLPLLFTLMLYLVGAVTRRFCMLKSRMILQVILIQCSSFAACFIGGFYFVLCPFNHGLDGKYIDLFALDKGPAGWAFTIVILLSSWIVWKRGSVSVSNPLTRNNMYNRFDLGIAALLLLLIIHALITVQLDTVVVDPLGTFQYIPFFLFAFLAIGGVMTAENQTKSHIGGFQNLGLALSFALVVVIFAVGAVFLFQSQLIVSAEVITEVSREVGRPFGAFFLWLVLFLYGPRKSAQTGTPGLEGSSQRDMSLQHLQQGSEGIIGKIVAWGVAGFCIVLVLVCLYILLRMLLHFLLKRTDVTETKRKYQFSWTVVLLQLGAVLLRLGNRFYLMLRPPDCAMDLYVALVRWGKSSGIAGKHSETAQEYAVRLIRYFPLLEKEISFLVDMIHLEIYGESTMDRQQLETARRMYKAISHPKHWLRRCYRLLRGAEG